MNKNSCEANKNNGYLKLVGVGPGDPSLVTIAAVEAIRNSSIITYPVSANGEESLAKKIASVWIDESKIQIPLVFPMVSDIEVLKNAWKVASDFLASKVSKGEQVVFLSQGDTSLFSTSSYLIGYMKINYPDAQVDIVPGVNSFSAAAAAGKFQLALQKQQLLITPTPENKIDIEDLINESVTINRNIIFMKVGRRWGMIRDVLCKRKLLERSLYAERVGFPDQKLFLASQYEKNEETYFSLVIVNCVDNFYLFDQI